MPEFCLTYSTTDLKYDLGLLQKVLRYLVSFFKTEI